MFLLPILLLPLSLAAAAPKPQYTCCRNPGWPATVLNFEYSDHHPDHTVYHGLTWSGWSGYNLYPGYPTGWSPIPSNYTTLLAKTGPEKYALEISPGQEVLEDIFSLWFSYREFPPLKFPSTAVITFVGWYQGMPRKPVVVLAETTGEGWMHVCFNWTEKEGGKPLPVDRLMILLPDCTGRKCQGKWFEVDDVWVRRRR
ncbi:hypothetical protein K440DRAFT_666797 [Wilcoxina mikolae CBS 423.85]|nr:hypothetical protein K440DRAFT_666797 [Wilcoxina mikolae CBS 423.85]